MKHIKDFLSKPATTITLLVLAAILLIQSGIGTTKAALTYFSPTYNSRLQLTQIGVSLLENDKVISSRDYQSEGNWNENNNANDIQNTGLLFSDVEENIKLGKRYPTVLEVQNSGQIPEFVRVTITKYWLDENDQKVTTLDPDLIELNYVNKDDWFQIDEDTAERSVYYYKNLLEVGKKTTPLIDSIKIDGKLQEHKKVVETIEDGKKVTTSYYTYDKLKFCVEAKVDAIQEHNAAGAIHSSWGKQIAVNGTTLSRN